jgi:hypothetical protein
MVYASRNPDTYCEQAFVTCDAYSESDGLHARLQEMAGKYCQFRQSNQMWQKEYARGHCKLNNLGARYSVASKGGVCSRCFALRSP